MNSEHFKIDPGATYEVALTRITSDPDSTFFVTVSGYLLLAEVDALERIGEATAALDEVEGVLTQVDEPRAWAVMRVLNGDYGTAGFRVDEVEGPATLTDGALFDQLLRMTLRDIES